MPEPGEYAEIIEDRGPASSGGASKTQRVLVRNPDGSEWEGYAKFAQDVNGQVLAEHGARGLASELLAARLGQALGANVPEVEPVLLRPGVPIRLQNGEVPAAGLAAVSHAVDPAVDVTPGSMPPDVSPQEVAALAALHSLIEAQDRGHNLVMNNASPYSVDHATAFASAWNLTDSPGQVVADTLLEPTLQQNPEAVRNAADLPGKLADADVERIVDEVPREWVPADEQRERLARNIKNQTRLIPTALRSKADDYENKGVAP